MRYRLWLSILSVIFTVSLTANVSAEKWELPDVGKMEVPPHVHFEEGEQSALPFLQDKGIKLYFTRKGAASGGFSVRRHGPRHGREQQVEDIIR